MNGFLKNLFHKEKVLPPHPSFTIKDGSWFYNKKWLNPIKPNIKVGFGINSLDEIQNIPFCTKVIKNTEGYSEWFAIAYGLQVPHIRKPEYNQEKDLSDYAKGFVQPRLFKNLNDLGETIDEGVPII